MKYIKEDLEVMLRNHLKNESKLKEIELKQEEYEERLDYAGTVHEDTDKEAIEGMQLKSQVLSDMPKSVTNNVSNITLNTVINYHKEMYHINKEDRKYLESKLKEFENERNNLDKAIVRVNNLLKQLSREEEFIIREFYMKKSKWDYIANEYFAEYQKPKSINQLLNIRDNAIESMLDILNTGI